MKKVFQILLLASVAICVALPAVKAADKCCQPTEQSQKKSKKSSKTVTETIKADIHCEKCVDKIMRTLPYCKGVKDVRVSIEKQTIDIKHDSSKCTKIDIIKELAKIDIKAQ